MFQSIWPFSSSWKRISERKQQTREKLIEDALERIREVELLNTSAVGGDGLNDEILIATGTSSY